MTSTHNHFSHITTTFHTSHNHSPNIPSITVESYSLHIFSSHTKPKLAFYTTNYVKPVLTPMSRRDRIEDTHTSCSAVSCAYSGNTST